jgi:DeoR/GlpR family transcriptional regulator of sugar metabolism
MLAAERRDNLLARLAADGKLVAKDVARDLGLSDDTVRRDLRDLAAAGLCQRVYGGALPVSPAIADYPTRVSVEPHSKQRVAARGAALIPRGGTVILDGGTTTQAVVRALPADFECTVITHSPTVSAALLDHRSVEVFMLGGRLFKHSAVASGSAAVEATLGISADVFLLGVTGVHPDQGLTTGDADEAAMKRALAKRAAETYVLASVEKIGTASRYRVLPLADVAGLVTDAPPDNDTLRQLRRQGVAILDADAPGSGPPPRDPS